jgi:transposase
VRAGPRRVSKRISAAHAARVLSQVTASGAVAQARCELAADFLEDLRRTGARMHEARKKLAAAVQASGTTLTGIFGVGPVVPAVVIGEAGDPARSASRDHFAAYNGTAPAGVSSGNRKACRLSRRGNRRLNHAVHMAAVTQVSQRHSDGRAYYDKKIAEGKTPKEALRALKRQASDAIYKHLEDAARAAARSGQGPGGRQGNDSVASAAGLNPEHRLFGQATPGPVPTPRPRPQKKVTSRATRKTARTT